MDFSIYWKNQISASWVAILFLTTFKYFLIVEICDSVRDKGKNARIYMIGPYDLHPMDKNSTHYIFSFIFLDNTL